MSAPEKDKRRGDEGEDHWDWVDTLTRLGSALGMNPIRVRWKLEKWRKSWHRVARRGEQRLEHARYEHKVCPHCGRVADKDDKICSGCGFRLTSRTWQMLGRLGLTLPKTLTMSSLLGIVLVAAYLRVLLADGGGLQGILSLSVGVLYRHGGHWPPAVAAGEYWRWSTAILLHAGIWHIGFNMFALSQVGPAVEEIFGRGRMVLLFMVTGVVANIGSGLLGLDGVGVGASGSLMGLCGLAAGWGHRQKTTAGTALRNTMIKWAVYTMIFGFFIGADNGAHAVGFVSGALFGYFLRPQVLEKSGRGWVRGLQGGAGWLLVLATLALVLYPP